MINFLSASTLSSRTGEVCVLIVLMLFKYLDSLSSAAKVSHIKSFVHVVCLVQCRSVVSLYMSNNVHFGIVK